MARTPKKKGDRLVVYPKQWPDTRVDKAEIDKDEPVTPHLGHEYRLTKKFSEQTEKPKSARETFSKRFRLTRAKHMPHPAPIPSGHYKSRHQEERPHYEETQAMTSKTYTEFVTEAAKRGRPRKLRPGEEADTLHLQDQLNKLTHPNHVEIHFKDGSKHRIPREHANMALHHLNSLKPIDRADHAEHMAKSHSNFYHVLSKKSIPSKKKTITLAGPKLRKEEAEQINELGDKTIKGLSIKGMQAGNHALAVVDSAEGSRLTPSDVKEYEKHSAVRDRAYGLANKIKAKMKKEEVEQIDEISKKLAVKTLGMRMAQGREGVFGDDEAARKADAAETRVKKKFGKRAVTSAEKIAHKELYGEEVELEESHRVGVTYSDPNSSAVSQRSEKKFKNVRVKAASEDEAIAKAKKHVKKQGYRVHAAEITTMKEEADKPKQHTKTDVNVRKHTRLAADALGRAHHLGKDHEDYAKHMAEYTRHRKLALGEEVDQIDEWGQTKRAITGPHAKTSTMAITPPKVGYKGKTKKPKVQTLTREELEIYEALSDEGKILFEKMSSEQLAKLVSAFPGKIKKGKYNAPRESEKTWPASKMKGSKWASTAGSINRKNQGYKK